jgi:hypothetical protein
MPSVKGVLSYLRYWLPITNPRTRYWSRDRAELTRLFCARARR